jgi:hypothetical protein
MQDSLDPFGHSPRRRDDAANGSRRQVVVRMHILSTLLSLALVALACGNGSTSFTGSTGTHKLTPTPTPPPSASSLLSNPPIDVAKDGLSVSSQGLLTCLPPSFGVYSDSANGPFLVLSANPASGASDLQQLSAFVQVHHSATSQATPPDTLQWIEGAPTMPQIGPFRGQQTLSYCSVTLDVTNTSTNPIQIIHAGLRLQATPQPNAFQYRLIDLCSPGLYTHNNCTGLGNRNGNIDCTVYGAQIQLASGTSGDEDLGSPVGLDPYENPCPALSLSPSAHVELVLNFGSADPLLYVGTLELKLATAGVQQTLVLSQAPTTLAFADLSQFTCYGLRGSTFAVESQGAAALAGPRDDPQTGALEFCI